MVELTALCSDEDCAEEILIQVGALGDLDRQACLCGCTWVVLDVAAVTFV